MIRDIFTYVSGDCSADCPFRSMLRSVQPASDSQLFLRAAENSRRDCRVMSCSFLITIRYFRTPSVSVQASETGRSSCQLPCGR